MRKKINTFLTFLLGCIFIFSGVVKGIDPFGTSLKIQEYLNSFNLSILNEYSDIFSVILCAMEIFLGLILVFRIFRKMSIILLFLIMSLFTVITAILAFDPYFYITDCGCFGEAFHISQTDTFLKNVIILLVIVYCGIYEFTLHNIHDPSIKKCNMFFAIYFVIGALTLPVYSLEYLPPIDFLGYSIDTNLIEKKAFNITSTKGEFLKDSLLNSNEYKFIVINRKPFTIKEKQNLSKVKGYCNKHKIECLVLQSYSFLSKQKAVHTKYFVDDITLKSIIRDINGVILIKDGLIKGKWTLKHKIIDEKRNDDIKKLIKKQKTKFSRYLTIILIYLSVPIVFSVCRNESIMKLSKTYNLN